MRRAIAARCGSISQVMMRPSGGRVWAMARAAYPVNVPISSTRRGASACTSVASSWPSTRPAIM
jgi:hypothetical protein